MVVVDQVVKHLATVEWSAEPLLGPSLLRGWLVLTYTTNTGGAFGILANHGLLFIITGVLVVAAMILSWHYLSRQPLALRVAVGMLLGGALGNLIDRARMGFVVDFIQVKSWPIFNLADSAIVCGVLLLMYHVVATPSSSTPKP